MAKATVIDIQERDGEKILIYDSGMERSASTGYIIKPPPSTLITSETATDFHRMRQEKKREAVMRGANAAVARHEEFGKVFDGSDYDFIEAGAEAVMRKALDRLDSGQVSAYKTILQEADFSSRPNEPATPPGTLTADAAALMALVDEIEQRKQAAVDKARAIEGKAE